MEIGTTELLFILIMMLILFGPDKLPEFARKLGYYYRKLNEYRRYLEEEIRKGYIEAERLVMDTGSGASKEDKHVEEDIHSYLKELAKEMGIDPEGKSRDELAREIKEVIRSRRRLEVGEGGGREGA